MNDLFYYLKNHLFKSIVCLCLSLAAYVAVIIPPILIGRFIDASLETDTFSIFFALLITCSAILTLILGIILAYFLSHLVASFVDHKYLVTVSQLLKKERLLFEQIKIGEIIDLFSRYIGSYEQITSSLIATFAPSIIGIVVIIIAIMSVSSVFIGFAVLAVEFTIFTVTYATMYFYSLSLRKYSSSAYELSNQWVEIFSNK